MPFALDHQNIKGKAEDSKTLASRNNNHVSHNHLTTTLRDSDPDYILPLQRTIGNQAVQRLLRSSVKFDFGKIGIQQKLRLSHPNDPYEREADTIAEQVIRMQRPRVPRGADLGKTTDNSIQRTKDSRGKIQKEAILQTIDVQNQILPQVDYNDIGAIQEGGQPMPESMRAFFEPRFGYDFSGVRIHTDSHATKVAKSINAKAFTIGNHIVFDEGQFAQGTYEGQKLLAHELTHTIQQQGAARIEHSTSNYFSSAAAAAPSPLATPVIQRDPTDIVKSAQQLEIDLTNSKWRQSLKFEGGQTQIVYVLRDVTTGEYLKVGKTTVDRIASRFGEYVTAGKKWSRKLVADVWTLGASSTKNVEVFEAEIRAGLEKAGADLPWDNTPAPGKGPRQGRPGQGIPDTKPMTETQFIDEVEQLRVKHADPKIPKRRGMSSREKAKLKAAEDKAAADALAKMEQVDKRPKVEPPKVEPPVAKGGATGTSSRVAIEASRLRTAGRFLAKEAGGLVLQGVLMALFPPKVHIHKENYDDLISKNIDPAAQNALATQQTIFNKLAADDTAKSIWATVTVELDFIVNATSGGDLEVYLKDIRFKEMKLSREYFLVEGKKFDLGKGKHVSKTVTYSVPIFGPATHGSEEPIRRYRKYREDLTDNSRKVRLATILLLNKIAEANPFLKSQLIRDLQGMTNDDDSSVQKLVQYLLSRLKPE